MIEYGNNTDKNTRGKHVISSLDNEDKIKLIQFASEGVANFVDDVWKLYKKNYNYVYGDK